MCKSNFSNSSYDGSTSLNKRISVIIPTKNEGKIIYQCLQSVFNQSVKPFEVVIVDGGSTDETLKEAQKFPVRILHESEHSFVQMSPANARNIGTKNARGDIILLLDADVILSADCLKYGVEGFKDPMVIAAIPWQKTSEHSRLERIISLWDRGSKTRFNIGVPLARVSSFVGFFRKDIFRQLEFDTTLGFGEDSDFYHRLMKTFKGFRVDFPPNCMPIVHEPHSLGELKSRYMWWGRTFWAYMIKYPKVSTLLNLGSLLLPTSIIIFLVINFLGFHLFLMLILLFILFLARSMFICVRSRSKNFVEFILFDFLRSMFFTCGFLQTPFVRRKGK